MNFRSFGVKILSVCLFALLLQGCRKDSIEEHDILDKQQKEVGFRSGTFPVDLEADVRLWWENHRSTDMWDTVNPNILTLDPVWEFGYETWIGALPVFLVPVSNNLDEEIPDSRYNLIFFEADDELDVRLLVFQSKESVSGDWDLNTFSGIAFNVDRSAQVQGLHLFHQGYYIELTQTLLDSLAALDLGGGDNSFDPECPKWGPCWPSWLSRMMNRISGWDIWHWEWDWANGSGNNSGGGGGSWFGGLWGPGDGPGDFGPGFLGLGGGIGIGANSSGPSPNHIPLSSNLLFSNEILNEGFKKLKHCDLNIGQNQDQVSLGGFMAQADYFKDRFDPYFSSGVDIYIQESGVRPLNEILQQPDHKWNWVNGHPYTKLLAPWARHLSAMIISKKVSNLYKYCIQHPNAQQPQIGNPSYSSDLCECMDQYSLGDANLDYTVDYLWTPEPFVTPNFATNVATSWPLIHGLGIRYDVDAIQDFYFNECTTHVSPETFEDCAAIVIQNYLNDHYPLLQFQPNHLEWLQNDPLNFLSIKEFLDENGYSIDTQESIDVILELAASGYLEGIVNTNLIESLFPTVPPLIGFYDFLEIATILHQLEVKNNGGCNEYCLFKIVLKARWLSLKDHVQDALDICSLFPIAGVPCDFTNGLIYSVDGDAIGAALSFASISGVPTTAGRIFSKVVRYGGKNVKLSWLNLPGGQIHFRGNLRSKMGLTDQNLQAHHLIPESLKENILVQKAAKSTSNNKAFHLHDPHFNGAAIHVNYHSGSHPNWNSQIATRIQVKLDEMPNITSQQAADVIREIQEKCKLAIHNNPNTHINNISIIW